MSADKDAGKDSSYETGGDQHSRLLDSIFQLDGKQRIKPSIRNEPSSEISEFTLAPIRGSRVHIRDLAKSIEKHANLSEQKVLDALKVKKFASAQKTLSKPLESHEAEKIRRTTGYGNLKKKISKWDALVQTNRRARSLEFPMNIEQLNSQEEDLGTLHLWKTQTPTALEAEIYEILGNNKDEEGDKKEEKLIKLTLQELRERRKEVAKLRIQQSYQEAKARRQKRIKSKKYHRILQRDKRKKQLQDFELLQKTDPEAALKQLEQLERARAKERMTLRHKNTGQWARSRLVQAKYDPLTRQQLAEQLAVSRDLMKNPQTADSDDEEQETIISLERTPSDAMNPWIAACSSSEIKEFVSDYQKYRKKYNEKTIEETKSLKSDSTVQGSNCIHKGVNVPLGSGGGNKEIAIVESESKSNKIPITSNECDEMSSIHKFKGTVNEACKEWNPEPAPKLKNEFDVAEKNRRGTSSSNVVKKAVKRNKVSLIDVDSPEIISRKQVKGKKQRGATKTSSSNSEHFGTGQGWVLTIPSQASNSLKSNGEMRNQKKRKSLAATEASSLMRGEERCESLAAFGEVQNKLAYEAKTKLEALKVIFTSESKDRDETQKNTTQLEEEYFSEDSPLAFKSSTSRVNVDEELDEDIARGGGRTSVGRKKSPAFSVHPSNPSSDGEALSKVDIDPANFIEVAPKLVESAFADLELQSEETYELEEQQQQKTVVEAFAGDDVIGDFMKEKEEVVNQSRPKDIDLTLPGWGAWGGAALDPSKRKKRRLIIKAPPAPRRRDANKVRVIINEEKAFKIPDHQVSEIPLCFSSVSDFEASIRAPVGNTWIPETAHKKLIKPAVSTKMGSVIKPLNEKFLMKKKVASSFNN